MVRSEIIVIPVLMLGDYFLTMAGAALFGKNPAERALYEANPRLRGAVSKLQMFHPRHLVTTAAVTAALLILARRQQPPDLTMFTAASGVLLTSYSTINGAHLSNIALLLLKRRLREGERLRQFAGAFRYAGITVLPLLVVTAYQPSLFMVGAVMGGAWLVMMHLRWAEQAPIPAAPAPAPRPPKPAPVVPVPAAPRIAASVAERPVARTAPALICGFCGQTASQAKTMIAGTGVFICDACVRTCVEVLAERETAAPGAN